ncbi:hypothetical protein [Haloparvum sedimenti]|nr:hypothetical protein [Haloparvum sedimenti]
MSESTSVYCGYCHRKLDQFATSAHGRRYCPECGAVPKEDQR